MSIVTVLVFVWNWSIEEKLICVKNNFALFHKKGLNYSEAERIPAILVNTVKPVLSGHSKIDKTKVFKTNGNLMKVASIAECSLGAFCNTFDLHLAVISLENQVFVFFLIDRLRQVLLHIPHRVFNSLSTG